MLGKYTIEIKGDDFIKGRSTTSSLNDGGFSPETTGINLISSTGNMVVPALTTTVSGLSDNIIATANDGNLSAEYKYFVGDTGKYYYFDGTTVTQAQNDTTHNTKYVLSKTDSVQYQLALFTTTTDNVTYLTGSTLGTADFSWWQTTKGLAALDSSSPHPMLIYSNKLYIADKNKIHQINGTTVTTAVLTLSSEYCISALGIDPGSGRMLIAYNSNSSNIFDQYPQQSWIGYWDSVNPTQVLKQVEVDEMVTAIYTVGGTTFVMYGNCVGYLTSGGIKFLDRLDFATNGTDDMNYKNAVTNISNILYFREKTKITAFGEAIRGVPAFWPLITNPTNSNSFKSICNLGKGKLGLFFATNTFLTLDVNATTTSSSPTPSDFYSNHYFFPRPVFFRSLTVEFASSLSNNNDPASAYIIDDTGTANALPSIQNTTGSSIQITQPTNFNSIKTNTIQLKYSVTNFNIPVRRFIIRYDVAE